jgi:hypothetical protein
MPSRSSHLLISFCNTTVGAPSLALLDLQSWSLSVLDVPDAVATERATGLAMSDSHLFVLTTTATSSAGDASTNRRPSGLWVFDREDLSVVARHTLARVYDAHSMLIGPDGLDVVSTGTDEVVRITLRGTEVSAEEVLWRPDADGPRADVHHLNGICRWNDRVIVSGFGKKAGRLWDSAHAGFAAAIPSGEIVAHARHPHSVMALGDTLAYCDSASAELRMLGSDRVIPTPGYARGLCQIGSTVFIGTSRGRKTSKSTGLLTTRADPGTTTGRCAIVCCSLDPLATERVIDLEPMGLEIYDILPVADVGRWPLVPQTLWRDRMLHGLLAGLDERDATTVWLHTEVAARDESIGWLHSAVADRDRRIEELHGEIAVRDRAVERLQLEIAERDQSIGGLPR